MLDIGRSFSVFSVADEQVVQDIARVSGDVNPIHLDENYAENSIFGKRFVHALFCHNVISMVLGNHLPGAGTILLSQSFQYKKPVYIGDVIETTVTVKQVLPKEKYVLDTICRNQKNEIILIGESKVKWKEKENP